MIWDFIAYTQGPPQHRQGQEKTGSPLDVKTNGFSKNLYVSVKTVVFENWNSWAEIGVFGFVKTVSS